ARTSPGCCSCTSTAASAPSPTAPTSPGTSTRRTGTSSPNSEPRQRRPDVFSRLLCLGVLAVLVAAPGCAKERESGPKLAGRGRGAGRPCRPASVNDFDLKFLTAEGVGPGKRSYLAEVQPDGTFTLNGSIGKGIPTGRYKVIIAGKVLDTAGKPTGRYLDR